MFLFILGGATIPLAYILLQLTCDADAFNINWRREAISVVIGTLAGLLCEFAMTGPETAWSMWTHYPMGVFVGAIGFIIFRGIISRDRVL